LETQEVRSQNDFQTARLLLECIKDAANKRRKIYITLA